MSRSKNEHNNQEVNPKGRELEKGKREREREENEKRKRWIKREKEKKNYRYDTLNSYQVYVVVLNNFQVLSHLILKQILELGVITFVIV